MTSVLSTSAHLAISNADLASALVLLGLFVLPAASLLLATLRGEDGRRSFRRR